MDCAVDVYAIFMECAIGVFKKIEYSFWKHKKKMRKKIKKIDLLTYHSISGNVWASCELLFLCRNLGAKEFLNFVDLLEIFLQNNF